MRRGRRAAGGLSKEEVAADQRRRLQSAMIEAVATRGYAAATTRELAKLAGVSKEDMYKRFSGKESFPTPAPEPSCLGEACQGPQSPAPSFQPDATASLTAGGNLPAGPTAFPSPVSTGKVKVVKRLAKDSHIVLSVSAPAKGRISVSGPGVRTVRRSVRIRK